MFQAMYVQLACFVLCVFVALTHAQETTTLVRELNNQLTAELRLEPAPPYFVLSRIQQPTADAAGSNYFTVHVDTTELLDPPALLGEYQFNSQGSLIFRPRYPLSKSIAYRMLLGPLALQGLSPEDRTSLSDLSFRLPPEPPRPRTTVTAVYPTADELPENVLKFYLHFSGPMSRSQAYQRVHLYQADERVQEPFLELGEELWNAEQTRFTLLIHPGRIKRGLQPREQLGPAMAAGKHYTLRIDKDWLDAHGQPLATAFEKKFSVTTADQEQLNPEEWKIETPAARSRQPVCLVFDEPLDHAMLSRVLEVKHSSGTSINGTAKITYGETRWEFVPDQPWPVATYHIHVATNLEDLCGNSIARPFEVKMQEGVAAPPMQRVAIEFIVK